MKYITLFETITSYNAATLDLPNVSLIKENMSVNYNPYVPETRVVVKYNITDVSNPTKIVANGAIYGPFGQIIVNIANNFSQIEIDGVTQSDIISEYTFSTVGEHIVKYTLIDSEIINNGFFYGCRDITSIYIPDSVTTIGDGAIYNCSGLTSIHIPDSVTTIGKAAIYGCSSLTSINIPNGVTSINNHNFSGCSSLTNIVIPNSVTSIDSSAFSSCSSIITIKVESGNTVYDSRNNCNAIIETNTNTLIRGCKTTMIPDSVTSIGSNAFNYCIDLTSIDIPDSVISIGDNAFQSCSNLTTIDIPDSVTSIGNSVFSSCTSFTSINIPDSVTSIGNGVFAGCISLITCTIGSGVTSIGNSIFAECTSLTSIISNAIIAPTISKWTFQNIKTGGTLTVPIGSSGYDVWMETGDYYLGKYNWTKVEQ